MGWRQRERKTKDYEVKRSDALMAKALANLVDEIRQAKKEEAVNKVISELMAKDLEWNAITIKKIAKWFEEKASQSDNDVCRQSALEIIEDRFSKL